MATELSGAPAEAARLALKMGHAAADMVVFMAELGEELPVIKPVLTTLRTVREKIETVKNNREELAAIEKRCAYMTSCVIVKFRQNLSSETNLNPLEECVKAAKDFIVRCSRRGKVSRMLKASSDKDEIAGLNARVDRLTTDLGLSGIATVVGEVANLKGILEQMSRTQEAMISQLPKPPAKLANIPNGTPTRKSWHVERRQVSDTVIEGLTGDGGPRLVGLVGDSGSGKTTVASEIVRTTEIRQAFSDGIFWLTVNKGAKGRLPSLMLQLARMAYTSIGGSVGRRPAKTDDGAAYVKQYMEDGHGGRGLKCLVVADNVWEEEVVAKLLETGMSILLSTRCEELVVGAQGIAVGVDEMSHADAESVLRKAAELPSDVRLPDDAVDLIELCGHVAMDLAFVGRWSTVRGRQDRTAWSDAVETVRAEMDTVDDDTASETAEVARTKRRKAILRAGFDDLGSGSEDDRVQRLYLSLAMMPDGHAFTARDAAVLLQDRTPSAEDEASAVGVVGVLERWSVIESTGNVYRMHDAHSSFARESIMDRGDVRRRAVKRWTRHISTLDAVRSIDLKVLKELWRVVEDVGGDGWAKSRPFVKALAEMDESDPLLRESIDAVGQFQAEQEDFEGASTTYNRLLEVEKRELGADHPFVLNTYYDLAVLADRLGKAEEAAEWRARELEELPMAVAKVKKQLDIGSAKAFHDVGLRSVASTILRLTPEDRDEAEVLLRRWLGVQEDKLGPDDVQVAYTLHELGVCVQEAGRLKEAEEMLRRCLGIQEAKPAPEDVQVAYTLHELGVCIRKAGRLEEAEELLRRCLRIQEAKLGPDDVQVAYTLHELGVCVQEAGRLKEAEEMLRRCLGIQEAKPAPEDVQVAYTLHELGVCIRKAGRLEEAEELLRRCLRVQEAKLGPDDVGVAYTLHELGVCVRHLGRLEEAEELLRRCLRIKEPKLGLEHVGVAYTLHELGACVQEAGRLEEAEALLRRCLGIEVAKLGPEDVGVATTLYSLGECIRKAKRLEEAEETLKRCLGIQEAKLGPEDVQVAYTLQLLGACVRHAGRLEEAEELLRRCLRIKEAKLGLEDVGVAYTLHELGVCVRDAARLEEAEALLRRCLGIENTLGPEDVGLATTLHSLDGCVQETGRREEAEELLRRGLGIEEATLGPQGMDVATTLNILGVVCVREAGRLEEAEQLFRRCLAIKEATLGPEAVEVSYTLLSLGICLQKVARLGEAEELFRRCLRTREASVDPPKVLVSDTLHHLGVCVREAGRFAEAEVFFRRCLTTRQEAGCSIVGGKHVPVGDTLRELDLCVRMAGGVEESGSF